MEKRSRKDAVCNGETALGIELGSSRIKATLIDGNHVPVAEGSYNWENRFKNGIWTYDLDDVWAGVQACFAALSMDVRARFDVSLVNVGAIGVSAMMHGYLAFDSDSRLLVPFRTWRNVTTTEAAKELTEKLRFNIPQRWSAAHVYQAVLNAEPHVEKIAYLTTLAGYVHWRLTGEKVIGIGDASGMFPIDSHTKYYDADRMAEFNGLIASKRIPWKIEDILPRVLCAGETAGMLTEDGARLVDPTGTLIAGIPLCPPEGDAGTGMVATNSLLEHTCNVSAGTSVFAMAVMDRPLSSIYEQIDVVSTPSGKPVAMVHCNTCTSDVDAWVRLLEETATEICGIKPAKSELYSVLYRKALEGDEDCGGLLSYNYFAGEPIAGLEEGRPLLARLPDSRLTLKNLMRTLLFSTLTTLRMGLDILTDRENIRLEKVLGHGGLFKSGETGQRMLAAALNTPVTVMRSAGEGGAWGAALLAAYMRWHETGESLDTYMATKVFNAEREYCFKPVAQDVRSFEMYLTRFKAGLSIEAEAVKKLN